VSSVQALSVPYLVGPRSCGESWCRVCRCRKGVVSAPPMLSGMDNTNDDVRPTIARRTPLPDAVLLRLASDLHPMVRVEILKNRPLPLEVIMRLGQ